MVKSLPQGHDDSPIQVCLPAAMAEHIRKTARILGVSPDVVVKEMILRQLDRDNVMSVPVSAVLSKDL